MPEEIKSDETVVDTTAIQKGTIRVGVEGMKNPTPTLLARSTKAVRYFSVSLITMVSATDIFTGNQSKVINFCLGVFILLLGAVDILVGVEPEKEKQ